MRRTPTFTSSAGDVLLAAVVFAAATVAVTWPQATLLTTHAHGHHDALFSMWRLAWIAEWLGSPRGSLFDAPIFTPTPRTFGFSDGVLLQGLVAFPFLRAGVPVLPVYNTLMLVGPWMSALGAWLLVRELTGSRAGALAAGLVFGLLPYRIEHAMHLELQWSQWTPLALWALHRTWHAGRARDGVLTGVFVLLQFLSCIYYGVFLTLFMMVMAPALWLADPPRDGVRTLRALAIGAAAVALPLVAYALPYRANQEALGTRSPGEIAQWSATWLGYLSTPLENRLYGTWTAGLGSPEGRLFPGLTAVVLAMVALATGSRRVLAWVWGLGWAVLLSLGSNTPVYGVVLALVPPLAGLRAPARFGMLVSLAVAVLAGYGLARLTAGWSRPRTALAAAVVCLALTAEYASSFGPLHAWVQRPPIYAQWLRSQPAGGVLHLPAPRGHALPLYDAEWAYLGTFDWHPRANGYSGYFPRQYLDLLGAVAGFPSDESLWALRKRGVAFVILHEDRYEPGDFLDLLGRLDRTPDLERIGRFPDPIYPVTIYRMRPQAQE
jgi:hypothetical protein